MINFRFFIFLSMLSFLACQPGPSKDAPLEQDPLSVFGGIKGPLLSTKFQTLEELKSLVRFEYFEANFIGRKEQVHLRQSCSSREIYSVLTSGISDKDIRRARDGSLWSKVSLVLNAPYLVVKKNDLLRVFHLARRRGFVFGEGDLTFYDVAEKMVNNIADEDLTFIPSEDLSEKGYLNTFNHVTGQALMTTLFSEKFTDFIADTHERGNMPELISGKFSTDQLVDREKGPIDNYVDIVNNEWGQELGKALREKHGITRQTKWTAELLADYFNDVQSYYSWTLQIGFTPFRADDLFVINFAKKINRLMNDISDLS